MKKNINPEEVVKNLEKKALPQCGGGGSSGGSTVPTVVLGIRG